MRTKTPSTLELQVIEHLAAMPKDVLLYPKTYGPQDQGVPVILLPYEFECRTCRDRGYAPRLVEAFRLGIRPTWCEECRAETHFRRERHELLNPRLLDFLEQRFIVDAEQPHRGHLVLRQRADFVPAQREKSEIGEDADRP